MRFCVYSRVIAPSYKNCNVDPYDDSTPKKQRKDDAGKKCDCTKCPNAFPHVAYEGRICYTLPSFAAAGNGPCESWCTNDATFGAGCGDPSSKMCAIDSTNCFDPQPTIDTWSAYSTAAAKAVKDEGVVQKLCDEPNVCESWREANSCGRRRLVHTTVDIAGPVAPR